MMRRKIGWIIAGVILIGIAVFVLIYTRPLTIGQRWENLDLSRCTGIEGYYFRGAEGEDRHFVLSPGDADFEALLGLMEAPAFRTRLRSLFPRGTKTHIYGPEDFRWSLSLRFEDVPFPDGSTVSGSLLHVDHFFGKTELTFVGESVACTLRDQKAWAREVMEILPEYAVE